MVVINVVNVVAVAVVAVAIEKTLPVDVQHVFDYKHNTVQSELRGELRSPLRYFFNNTCTTPELHSCQALFPPIRNIHPPGHTKPLLIVRSTDVSHTACKPEFNHLVVLTAQVFILKHFLSTQQFHTCWLLPWYINRPQGRGASEEGERKTPTQVVRPMPMETRSCQIKLEYQRFPPL